MLVMVVLSKILHPFYTTISCHELAHTWSSSCPSAAAGVFRTCMVESLKIYGLLYLVSNINIIKRIEKKDQYKGNETIIISQEGNFAGLCFTDNKEPSPVQDWVTQDLDNFRNQSNYNLGRYKMEQLSPIPPKAMMKARRSKSASFWHHWNGGRGGPGVPFILSKIVCRV